jgi:hypothetical protein
MVGQAKRHTIRRVEGSEAGGLPAFMVAEFTCTPILCRVTWRLYLLQLCEQAEIYYL